MILTWRTTGSGRSTPEGLPSTLLMIGGEDAAKIGDQLVRRERTGRWSMFRTEKSKLSPALTISR